MIDYCAGPDCWVCQVLLHQHPHHVPIPVVDTSGQRQGPAQADAAG